MRRIVVTGMGAVSPLGANVGISWSRLLAGQSGIRRLGDRRRRRSPLQNRRSGPLVGRRSSKAASIPIQFWLRRINAKSTGSSSSHWRPLKKPSRKRSGSRFRMMIGYEPRRSSLRGSVAFLQSPRRFAPSINAVFAVSPLTIPSFLVNLAAGHVSIRHGFKGPLGAPVTACAAGVQAIGDAARLIRANEADIAVCGGTEACMNIVRSWWFCSGPISFDRLQRNTGPGIAPIRCEA